MNEIRLVKFLTFDALDEKLQAMNGEGISPDLPFIDAGGTANIAHGTAPGGDGWAVDYEPLRDADSGMRHCCDCQAHWPNCELTTWEPTFPVIAMCS